ncbi:hypothetical protein K227x_57490 [Rubripirellula lacrimiformis]|uniref:Uncharacterized protein n=1 Tax=Rubripirellula lacrimiformis TaxID=1930273 RepID=A0A517NJL3_9BACT|nr:hypothetical protein [Rubripirellula lacrimiformis]QDT07322.1 hypothetical protein K227x_57490 [Rubripirellula lacrimiformis]
MTPVNVLAGLWLLLAVTSANAQSLLDITFNQSRDVTQFEPLTDGVTWGTARDQSCLIVDAGVATQALKPIAVESPTKYKLTLRAAVDDSDTIETNDRIAEIMSKNGGRSFAECELDFFDSSGNKTTFLLYGSTAVDTSGIAIVSGEFRDCVFVFYAPPNADTLRLSLTPRKRTLYVQSLKLEPETTEGTVNCNPDFRYGQFNAGGWRPNSEGRLFKRPDNRTVMKCGSDSRSSFFPVDDESRYSFLCQGTGYGPISGKVIVTFYDEAGQELGYTHLFWDRDMQQGATKSGIQPIPGSKFAMLKPSRIILEKVMVTEDDPT